MEQMTAEQAIQEIQYYMNHDSYIDAPSNDACKLAIDALKKQVPKKTQPMGMSSYCPVCGSLMFKRCHDKCCGYCGQTLDWT